MFLRSITLETPDVDAVRGFYDRLDVAGHVDVCSSTATTTTTGFRGFTLSLVVPQPSTVDALAVAARDHGASVLKPVAKGFWGYGGVVRAPDGSIWKFATSSKKETGARHVVDDVVLLLGVADVRASKKFYLERGLTVKRSFGSKYVEFDAAPSSPKLALHGRRALAKDAGVPDEDTRAHGLVAHGDGDGADGASFTDPDGFTWKPATA